MKKGWNLTREVSALIFSSALTAKYQKADSNASSTEKWKLMERIFHLYDAEDWEY